ncbi:translation initiation factor eIF-2B subunit delta [Anopheles nili]|uniref:translation initiation factor eIF-2B subunit delta n=1 Tax=Anopheles nili TaxID=185578 RepID=UPI00237A1BB5|nr:translation initiation factor eIF-2B subunit delta [Anopheles nili]
METAASSEPGTMKKKRNRSHKKSKPEKTVRSSPVDTSAEQVSIVGKENNPPVRTAVPVSAASCEISSAIETNQTTEQAKKAELSRKPSRRGKRKPKNGKEDQQNSTIQQTAAEQASATCHILFKPARPGIPNDPARPDNQTVERANVVSISTKPVSDISKNDSFQKNEILLANADGILKNIELEQIFPGSNLFRFDTGGSPVGKLTLTEPCTVALVLPESPRILGDTGAYKDLVAISADELFPKSKTVGHDPIGLKANQTAVQPCPLAPATNMSAPVEADVKMEKSREEILAEREAKKAAKLAAKGKSKGKPSAPVQGKQRDEIQPPAKPESLGQPNAPSELKKSSSDVSICEKMKDLHISDVPTTVEKPAPKELSKAERKAQFEAKNPSLAGGTKPAKPALSKAERRAIQEAQRAAKAEVQQAKKRDVQSAGGTSGAKQEPSKKSSGEPKAPAANDLPTLESGIPEPAEGGVKPPRKHIVNLFNHLHQPKYAASEIVNSPTLHPAVTKLGIQYAEGAVVGSKARCLALLKVLNQLIHDYETPPGKEFGRSFEETLTMVANHLHRCRPFSVSMTNAMRDVKMHARQLDGKVSDSEQKESLLESIESYISDHIEKAEDAICLSVQQKICDGDVILTYGCSSLIKRILQEAHRRSKKFRLIIVNARPRQEENGMLEYLVKQGVKTTCVLINAVSYVMPQVTKVLLSAHALLANGSVMSRVGTAQIALVAKSHNVPVLVCCETHKFTERVQTDAFVYNELGKPDDLIQLPRIGEYTEVKPMLTGWEAMTSLTILNLHYDVTPPELVTAVVTEVAILPCTSVPVILRIKPSDVAY